MVHKEYVRIVPDADTAVLFIHGIVGTPNHFKDIVPLVDLVPDDWSVYNVLLDGHGKTVEAFAKTSMEKWHRQVWDIFHQLASTHSRVVLVAHSMGTLFSIRLAVENPGKVPFLFLLNVPFRPGIRLMTVRNLLRLTFGKLREDIPLEAATKNVCGVQPTPLLWKYLPWIPRYLELFQEIHRAERVFSQLCAPCVAFQSWTDELVARSSAKVLQRNKSVLIHTLLHSTHFYYSPEDTETIRTCFSEMLKITHD